MFRGFDADSLGAEDLTLMNVGWTGKQFDNGGFINGGHGSSFFFFF